MNTKTLVTLAILVGIGTVLHTIIPGFFLGMKPDMMLTMMFLGILLFPNVKNVLLIALATGVISGLTTTFPGGFLPNLIDKPVTAFLFYGLMTVAAKYSHNALGAALLTLVGTVVSGTVFLTAAYLIVGLPGPFAALFATVVLPAMALNAIAMFIIYPIAKSIIKRSNVGQHV